MPPSASNRATSRARRRSRSRAAAMLARRSRGFFTGTRRTGGRGRGRECPLARHSASLHASRRMRWRSTELAFARFLCSSGSSPGRPRVAAAFTRTGGGGAPTRHGFAAAKLGHRYATLAASVCMSLLMVSFSFHLSTSLAARSTGRVCSFVQRTCGVWPGRRNGGAGACVAHGVSRSNCVTSAAAAGVGSGSGAGAAAASPWYAAKLTGGRCSPGLSM